MKGGKKISDVSKRLRGTDQPCRMDGELVQLAVRRYYKDLLDALDKGWYFDRKAAMRAIKFIGTLKHTKGEWAGQKFILWMYAEYDTFRRVYKRWLKKQKRSPK